MFDIADQNRSSRPAFAAAGASNDGSARNWNSAVRWAAGGLASSFQSQNRARSARVCQGRPRANGCALAGQKHAPVIRRHRANVCGSRPALLNDHAGGGRTLSDAFASDCMEFAWRTCVRGRLTAAGGWPGHACGHRRRRLMAVRWSPNPVPGCPGEAGPGPGRDGRRAASCAASPFATGPRPSRQPGLRAGGGGPADREGAGRGARTLEGRCSTTCPR